LFEHHPSRTWRHIDSGTSSGSRNMAIDEALLSMFDPQTSEPILRTYGWEPSALSLGRFQKAEDVLDLDRCQSNAVSVVRRVSGGGTIYHADELTYSIVCSPDHIPSGASVKESFRVLTGFLIEYYRRLGLDARYAVDSVSASDQLGVRTAFCFAGKESFDILIDGHKIGGNAQRRLKNVIFQHGSIPIINRARRGLQFMKDRSPEYADTTISLADCGISADFMHLKRMIVDAFSHHMGVQTCMSSLTPGEQSLSQELLLQKYTSDRWNLQGDAQ